jgi:RNA recognition motif-containing protein
MADEAAAPPTNAIYTAGFSGDLTEDDFTAAFGSFGEVTKVLIRGKDKPFAFVTFAEEASAQSAVEAGSINLGGADCTVEAQTSTPRARKPRKPRRANSDGPPPNNSSIYVKGIPGGEGVTDKLRDIFGGFGEIAKLTYKGRDYAFVEYTSPDGMNAALAGSDGVTFDDEPLTVEERTSTARTRAPRRQSSEEDTGPNTTIYVKGVPENTDTDAIKDKFGAFGDITKVMNRSNRGFVFISYATPDEMNSALGATHDWDGEELLVEERRPKGAPRDAE